MADENTTENEAETPATEEAAVEAAVAYARVMAEESTIAALAPTTIVPPQHVVVIDASQPKTGAR